MNGARKSLAETVAGVAAGGMDEAWARLARPAVSPTGFDPAVTESLPEPARRWLTHVIAPGTPLARAVILDMRGHRLVVGSSGGPIGGIVASPREQARQGFLSRLARGGPAWVCPHSG